MATNNIPDLSNVVTVNFNSQVFHDILLKMQIDIEELKTKLQQLENERRS